MIGEIRVFRGQEEAEDEGTDKPEFVIVRIDMCEGTLEVVDTAEDSDEAHRKVMYRLEDEYSGSGTTCGFMATVDFEAL